MAGGGGGRSCGMTVDPLVGLPQSPSDKPPYRRQRRRRGHDGSLAVEGTLRRPPRVKTTKPHHGGGFAVAGKRCLQCDSAESIEGHESIAARPFSPRFAINISGDRIQFM